MARIRSANLFEVSFFRPTKVRIPDFQAHPRACNASTPDSTAERGICVTIYILDNSSTTSTHEVSVIICFVTLSTTKLTKIMACVKCRGIADLPLEFFNPPLRYGRQAGLYSNARDTQYDDDPDAVIELSYESYVEGCSTPANPSPANPSPTYSPTSPTSPIYSPQADPSPTNPSPTYSPTYSPTSPAYSLTADPSPNFSPTSPLFEQDFTSKSPDPPAHEISYNHWPNATDLKKSTEDGCAGCALILESLLQHSSSYGEPPSVQDKVDNLQALLSGPPAPIILTSLNTAFNSIIDWYYRRHIDFEPNELIRHLKVACATAKEDGELEFFVKHGELWKIL